MVSAAKINFILLNDPDPTVIDMAAGVLRNGGLVVAPTETRYGLLARTDDDQAVKRVYDVKGRSMDQPTAIFVDSVENLSVHGRLTPVSRFLASRYLPGPLTLNVKAVNDQGEPLVVDGKIGLRVSPSPVVAMLLERTDFPLTATSANLSGYSNASTVNEIAKMLGDNVDLYIDGGELNASPSTVVDCTEDSVRVLREGAIPPSEIMASLQGVKKEMSGKFVILFVCTGNTCRSPMAEGALRMLLSKERPGKFEVISAGTAAAVNYPATMYAIEAAKVWDVDISNHQSQPLTPTLIDKVDLIFGVSAEHVAEVLRAYPDVAERTYLFKSFPESNRVGEGVDDPIGKGLDQYNETFLEIGEYIGKHLDQIVKKIDEKTNAQ